MSSITDEIRAACARVARDARFVRIDEEAFLRWVDALAVAPPPPSGFDPAHHRQGDPDAALAYVITLDAINFGSGWFPVLRKREGKSGYFTIATALSEHFALHGPWDAAALQRIDARRCAALFGQQDHPPVAELMALFARALGELGSWLATRHGGSFAKAVETAGESAERLVGMLAEMPLYRDVARYGGLVVPFYKRAQLTASDLAAAFGGSGPGRFRDLDRLTIFADNLVPHVLRCEGVLRYERGLASRIEREELLAPGSPEEVEIRAVALHAVEHAVAALHGRGMDATARGLDTILWNQGQRPEIKAHPRHRTRCAGY